MTEDPRFEGTRFIDTQVGPKTYSDLAPFLALGLERVMKRISSTPRAGLRFTFGFIMDLHAVAFRDVHDWAGKPRNKNVQIRNHIPPDWPQAQIQLHTFADDLEYRTALLDPSSFTLPELAQLLAFCEGRFTNIHPFRDYNGRISRVLLYAILFRIGAPSETPLSHPDKDQEARKIWLDALEAYDHGDSQRLIDVWLQRILVGLVRTGGLSRIAAVSFGLLSREADRYGLG